MMRGLRSTVAFGLVGLAAMPSAAFAQENKFGLSADVIGGYDSNALRLSGERYSGPRDNFSITPNLSIDFSRLFGRQRLFLSGSIGYVKNSRFSFLDREQINLTGGTDLKFGASCTASPTASIYRAQSDLEDLGAPIRNTVNVQEYNVTLVCKRSFGFYPKLSGGYTQTDNSERRRDRDQHIIGGRASLVYTRPSLGGVEAFYERSSIDRPNSITVNLQDVEERIEVSTFGLRYQRSVGSLIDLDVSVGRTHANPNLFFIPSFTGVTYAGSVSYKRSSRGTLRLGFDHSVSAKNNVGSSYFINSSIDASITLRPTARISTDAAISYATRRFRGEDTDLTAGPRNKDKILNVKASATYRLNRKISLTLSGRHRIRNSDNNFYEYSSTQMTVGASISL